MIAPFALLLLCIALMPLFAAHFWEDRNPKASLGLLTAAYYAFVQKTVIRCSTPRMGT